MQGFGRKKFLAGIWGSVLKVRFSGDGPVMVLFQSSHSGDKQSNHTKGSEVSQSLKCLTIKIKPSNRHEKKLEGVIF